MALTGYGLTSAGFLAPSMDTVLSAVEADLQADFGAGIDLSPSSNFGQLAGVITDRVVDLWNLGLAIYTGQTVEGATGTAQDSVNSLTGCIREVAEASIVQLLLTGTDNTTIDAGSIAAVTGQNGNQFGTAANLTIHAPPTPAAWAPSTSYATGVWKTNVGNTYYCTSGGVSAGSGGPTGTGSGITDSGATWAYVCTGTAPATWRPSFGYNIGDIVACAGNTYYCTTNGTSAAAGGPSVASGSVADNSAVWAFAGQGTAAAYVQGTATNTGPLAGPAGAITVIVTPVSGWEGVFNPADAVLGRNTESDSAYRARRDETLGNEGKGYLDAIRAAVLNVDQNTTNPVTACTVFENDTDTTSVDGIPPHAIEALVQGGADQDVAVAIFGTIPAGIQPFGQSNTVTETVTDSAGNPHTVQFSRPTAVPIYVTINVTVNPESPQFNATDGGQVGVMNQLVLWGNGLGAGFDVDATFASAQAFVANVGAWRVTSCFVGVAPSPAGSSVSISARQLPTFNAANMVVNITQAAP